MTNDALIQILDSKEKLKELLKYISNIDKDWSNEKKSLDSIKLANKWVMTNQSIIDNPFLKDLFSELKQMLSQKYCEFSLHYVRLKILQEIERRFYYIYKHTCPNGKVYIGVTSSDEVEYRWVYGQGYKKNKVFYNDIQLFGWDNITHEILFSNLTPAEAEIKEQELISLYKSNDSNFGYNIDKGGKLLKPTLPIGKLYWIDISYQEHSRRRPYKIVIDEKDIDEFMVKFSEYNPHSSIVSRELIDCRGNQYYFIVATHPSHKEIYQ